MESSVLVLLLPSVVTSLIFIRHIKLSKLILVQFAHLIRVLLCQFLYVFIRVCVRASLCVSTQFYHIYRFVEPPKEYFWFLFHYKIYACSSGKMLKRRSKDSNNNYSRGFPGGAVVKNPPANAGDGGSIPGPGRSHMPRSN